MAAGDVISEQEYQRWIHPPYALALLHEVADVKSLILTIADHLEDGLIRSVAETVKVKGADQRWHYAEVDSRFWIGWPCLADHVFWRTGNRETFSDSEATRRSGLAAVRLYRVRFHPDDIDKLLPPPLPTREPSPQALAKAVRLGAGTNAAEDEPSNYANGIRDADSFALRLRGAGGRPRKEFWEPLLTAMAAQLYNGDLKPRTQADVERAMHEWLEAQGDTASEGAVRQRARQLWKKIEGQ